MSHPSLGVPWELSEVLCSPAYGPYSGSLQLEAAFPLLFFLPARASVAENTTHRFRKKYGKGTLFTCEGSFAAHTSDLFEFARLVV